MRNLDEAGPQGIDEVFLKDIAEITPGLEIDGWEEAFASELEAQAADTAYESPVETDGKLALDLKLPAGPAVVITGIGGVETLSNTPSLDEVRAAIERVDVADASP